MLMTEALLSQLNSESDLCGWVQANDVTLATFEAWMAQSRTLYATDLEFARRIAEAACKVARCVSESAKALANWMLGNALVQLDDFKTGTRALSSACRYYLATGQSIKAAQASIGLIAAFSYMGELEQAVQTAEEAERVLLMADEHPLQSSLLGKVYNNLGLAYEKLQQFEQAISAFDRKLEMLPQGYERARTLLNRAGVLATLNLFDEANADFGIVEAAFIEAGAAPDLVRLYLNWGMLDAHWKRHESAETHFEQATLLLDKLDDSLQLSGYVHHYRALNWLVAGEAHPQLGNELNKARLAFEKYGLVSERGLCWVTIGRYHIRQADRETAAIALNHALEIADHHANMDIRWQVYFARAELFLQQGRFEAAIEQARLSIATIESLRATLNIGTFRATFLTDKLAVYLFLARLHLERLQPENALLVLEQARARLLAERLQGRMAQGIAPLTQTDDPQVRTAAMQLQSTLTAIDQLRKQLAAEQPAHVAWGTFVESETTCSIAKLEQEAVALTRYLQQQRPDFEPLSTGTTRALPELVQHLPSDSCVLYFTILEGDVWCFVIDRKGILHQRRLAQFAAVDAARERLTLNIERTLAMSASKGNAFLSRMMPIFLAEAQTALQALGDLLIEPIASMLEAYNHWIIAPEGKLYYVPFHALRCRGRYLIEQVTVSYTPSLNVLHLAQQPPKQTGDQIALLGYGGERLPNVAREIERLAQRFPSAEVQHAATTDFFLHEAERFRLIHIAAHAYFHKQNAMLSAFELADRSLTLAEISQLHLSAELMTLSACETGFGRMQGSEFISLASGLMGAGARSLVVSQWKVDDDAAVLLMDAFYDALQQGASRVTALQHAQRHLLQLTEESSGDYKNYAHPAFWSPFILIGNWQPLFQSENR